MNKAFFQIFPVDSTIDISFQQTVVFQKPGFLPRVVKDKSTELVREPANSEVARVVWKSFLDARNPARVDGQFIRILPGLNDEIANFTGQTQVNYIMDIDMKQSQR